LNCREADVTAVRGSRAGERKTMVFPNFRRNLMTRSSSKICGKRKSKHHRTQLLTS
jgi:hypothetical protein